MLDTLIKGGTIIDGTGGEAYCADLGIKDGKIVRIGRICEPAERVIDATGLTVTPGFIDSHSHSDKHLFTSPEMKEKCEQGITTSVGGQCGSSRMGKSNGEETLSDFFNKANNIDLGSNLISFIGHGTVRASVMNYENREPTEYELERMKELVREAVRRGAV